MSDFDVEKLMQAEKEANDQKRKLQTMGTIGDALANSQSEGNFYLGRMNPRQDVSGHFDKMAASVESPLERQKKLLEAYQSVKGLQKAQEQDKREADLRDPKSARYKALIDRYRALKMNPAEGITGQDAMELYGDPGKLSEIQMRAATDFQNDLKKIDYQKQAELAQIAAKNHAELASNPAKYEWERLPEDTKKTISGISEKQGNMTAIKRFMDSSIAQLDDPNISETQKVKIGQEMLKMINSPLGADAVGADEAKRLGSFLERKFFNLTEPGSMFGRDLNEFITQAKNDSNRIGETIKGNEETVQALKSGKRHSEIISKPYDTTGRGPAAPKVVPPKDGEVRKGYRFKGGDPADKNNWEKM